MKSLLKILLVFILFMLNGCAKPPLSNDEIQNIKSIGIINNFPTNPTYTIVGTTIFNNTFDDVPDLSLKDYLSELVITSFSEKNYNVEMVDQGNKSDFDLIIKISPHPIRHPMQADNLQGTDGYGFAEHYFLGKQYLSVSYVSLGLYPIIEDYIRCNDDCWAGAVHYSPLPINSLPDKWEDLSPTDQQSLIKTLKETIKLAVEKAVPLTGV